MSKIDFLVIGAQKCGTTSLHMYMKEHPELFLPPQKELDFFSNDSKYAKGMLWYLETYFAKKSNKISGEISPQYTCFYSAAERICKYSKEIKLIAILRNPIDRYFSHYKMAVRRGIEKRAFSNVLSQQIENPLDFPFSVSDQSQINEEDYYLTFGLYGKMLRHYLNYFERKNILLLFLEDLEKQPEEELAKVFTFIGVDNSFVPTNIKKKYHAGGVKRFPNLEKWINRQKILINVFKKFIRSENSRRMLRFWFEMINIKTQKHTLNLRHERELLRIYYQKDIEALERDYNIKVPWDDLRKPCYSISKSNLVGITKTNVESI